MGSASLEAKGCRKPGGLKGTGGFRGLAGWLWPFRRTARWVRPARNSARGLEENSGTADLRPPGVHSDGGGRRPAELPRLAPSPAVAPVAVLAHPQTGDIRYGVPSGSNHYWELAGKVIGTETYTSPGIGALELKNLDDVVKR